MQYVNYVHEQATELLSQVAVCMKSMEADDTMTSETDLILKSRILRLESKVKL